MAAALRLSIQRLTVARLTPSLLLLDGTTGLSRRAAVVRHSPASRACANVASTQKPELRLSGEPLTVSFVTSGGETIKVKARVGDTLLNVVNDNELDFDGFGSCGGSASCSTCHVILSEADYKKIGEIPTDEEMDMITMAAGQTNTSRLGCQLFLTKNLDGLVIRLPQLVRDARND